MTLQIFGTIMTNFLENAFEEELHSVGKKLVKATVDLFHTILEELRPTPAKPHYTFNMRDISKVFQGMLMMDKRRVVTKVDLGRMWVHENQRVFGDRLVSDADKSWLLETLEKYMEQETDMKGADLWKDKPEVICTDFMVPGAEIKVYEEVNKEELQVSVCMCICICICMCMCVCVSMCMCV